jgi:hypothetical protein
MAIAVAVACDYLVFEGQYLIVVAMHTILLEIMSLNTGHASENIGYRPQVVSRQTRCAWMTGAHSETWLM